MAQRAPRLKKLLASDRRTSEQAQRSFMKTEDRLTELEDREQRRAERDRQHPDEADR